MAAERQLSEVRLLGAVLYFLSQYSPPVYKIFEEFYYSEEIVVTISLATTTKRPFSTWETQVDNVIK